MDFPEVELRLFQKRNWRVVISQKRKFEDDILLREARALCRGLQVMVCAEHVRIARVRCLTDSMSCALAFERRLARNFEPLVQIRKLTSLCLRHQNAFHVRWIASESNCSDDPSRRPDSSQYPSRDFSNNIFDSLFSSCADESLTNGNEGAMFARTTEFGPFELESPSRVVSTGTAEGHHKLPFQDAETPERDQSGVLGECLPGHERLREDRIAMGRPYEKKLSSLELQPVKNSVRYHQALQEFLQHTLVADNPLVADAEVDEALVAHFNEKYRVGYSSSAGDICLSNVPLFSKVRERRRALLATQPSRPPELEAPHPAQEQGSSRVVHMGSADPGEHGRQPVVDGDVQHQTRGTVDHYRESAPVTKCFFTQKTDH